MRTFVRFKAKKEKLNFSFLNQENFAFHLTGLNRK